MGLTTREIGSSSFNDMISSIDRRSEFVENRAGANVTTNNALISYGLSNSCSILNAPCGYGNGVYPSLTPIQTFGSELATNGTFDTDLSGWTYSSGVTWNNGKAEVDALDGSFKYIEQIITSLGTKTYKISFEVSNIQGAVQLIVGNSLVTEKSTNGTFEVYYKTTTTNPAIQFKRKFGTNTFFELDNVSVKEVIDADFDFTRGSSATRVNELGLVQDVQLLSGELVQNGNFEQIGSERVTNGDFSNGSTDWSNPDNAATFSNDSVTISGGSGNRRIYQENVTSPTSSQWKLQYEITEKVGSSDLKVYTTNSGTAEYTIVPSSVGIHTFYFNSNLTRFYFNFSNSTGSITIDNVSVKEVGQNWTVANDDANNYVEFNQEEGTVRLKFLNTSPITTLTSDTQYLSGKKYKLTVDVKEVVSGGIKIDAAGVSQTYNSVGIQEAIIEPTGGANINFYRATANVDITLNSVSLIEITDDTDLPRINYKDGEGSLLLEPQSTNLITYSEDFSQSDWSKTNISITTNSAISPDGTINASLLTENSSNAQHFIGDALTLTSGTSYSVSVYAKKKERSVLQISPSSSHIASSYANYDLDLGVVSATGGSVTAEIEYLSNDWYRCILKFTATNTATASLAFFIQTSTTALRGVSYQGDGTSGLYLWGAQVEAQSFATSYIPTNGSTVTRLADVCNNAGSSDLINSTEGVLYAEIAALADDLTNKFISISNGSKTERVEIGYSNVSNKIFALSYVGNVNQCNIGFVLPNMLDYNKIAISYAENNFALWVNGVKVGVDLIGSVSAQNTLNELAFDEGDGTDIFYSKTKCVAVFKEALTDEELTCLTTI